MEQRFEVKATALLAVIGVFAQVAVNLRLG
jgi:hypothetical protein